MVADDEFQSYYARKRAAFPGLGVRARNGLWNSKIETKEQVSNMTDAELLRIPNFGRKALAEVRAWAAGCTAAELESATKRELLRQRINRVKAEVQRAQEKLRWLEAEAAAYDRTTVGYRAAEA